MRLRKSLMVSGSLLMLTACQPEIKIEAVPVKSNVAPAPPKEVDPYPDFNRDAAEKNVKEAIMSNVKDPLGCEFDPNLRDNFISLPGRNSYAGASYLRIENKYGGHDRVGFFMEVTPDGEVMSIEFSRPE